MKVLVLLSVLFGYYTTYWSESMQEVLGVTLISFKTQSTFMQTSQLVLPWVHQPNFYSVFSPLKAMCKSSESGLSLCSFSPFSRDCFNVLTLCSKKINEYDSNTFCSISLPEMRSSKVKNRWYVSFLSSGIKTGSCTMYCHSDLQ